jgi:hypothetical protein
MTDFNTALGDAPADSLDTITANLEKMQALLGKKDGQ